MQLTPEDIAKLETKELANVIRRLNEGKTLTAAQRALLAKARAGQGTEVQTPRPGVPPGFAQNWDDLAQALGVSRKSLQNWRGREELQGRLPTPRADGRHEVAAWARAMVDLQLARADEDEDGEFPRGSVTDWKRRREQLACTRLERDMAKEDGALMVATELEVAFGQLLAGICASLNQLPGSASRFLVGLRDIHVIQMKLEDEVATALQHLGAVRYLEQNCVRELAAELVTDDAMREHVIALTCAVLGAVGQRAIAQLTAPTAETPSPEEIPPVPELGTAPPRPAPPEKASSPSAGPKLRGQSKSSRSKGRGSKPPRRRAEMPAAALEDQASDRPQPSRRASTRRRRA